MKNKKQADKKRTALLVGGGTGGHLFPAIALSEALSKNAKYDSYIITDERCKRYIPISLGLKFSIIKCKISYKNIYTKILSIVSLLKATFYCLYILVKVRPDVIIGFGGYTAFPVLILAILFRIRIIVYEPNALMGKVNKFFAKFAYCVALAYEKTENYKPLKSNYIVVGDLVREKVKNLPVKQNFDNEKFCLFIIGGSQGAKIFSELLPDAIRLLMGRNHNIKLRIIQQAKTEDHNRIAVVYNNLDIKYTLSEFYHDISACYQEADLVISRAGSSTIAELKYIGLPFIMIPLPQAAENHQLKNAISLSANRCAWYFQQSQVTPQILADHLIGLINNRTLLKEASLNLIKHKQDGSQILADFIGNMPLTKK